MKKKNYLLILTIGLCGLASCSDNGPSIPDADYPTLSEGAYVLNQGNFYNGISGGLNVIDYDKNNTDINVFKSVNGRSLGDTPQCGIAYGSKIYVGTSGSNTIEIMNRSDYKSVKQIRLSELTASGNQPRSMVASNGKIYIAMYDGYVSRLDTVSMTIDKVVKVGPNPEIMALYNGKLYVPNSDGMNYPNYGITASIVDLETMTETSKFTVPMNPDKFMVCDGRLLLLCKGNYADQPAAVYEVNEDQTCTKIAEATIAAVSEDTLYMINLPFTVTIPDAQYMTYQPASKALADWQIVRPDYPSDITIDKIGKKILISSYVMSGPWPSYDAPGYVNVYDEDSNLLNRYTVGSGPTCIFFNNK